MCMYIDQSHHTLYMIVVLYYSYKYVYFQIFNFDLEQLLLIINLLELNYRIIYCIALYTVLSQ